MATAEAGELAIYKAHPAKTIDLSIDLCRPLPPSSSIPVAAGGVYALSRTTA